MCLEFWWLFKEYQINWLGKARYELWKTGKYSIQRFIDPLTDQKYTLKQLKEMDKKLLNC